MEGEYVISTDLEKTSEIRYEKPAEEICGINMGGEPKKTLHYTKKTENSGKRHLTIDERGRITLEMDCPVLELLSGSEEIDSESRDHVSNLDEPIDCSQLEQYDHNAAHEDLDRVVAELEQEFYAENQLH